MRPALKLVKEHPLADVATVAIVGKRVPIDELKAPLGRGEAWLYRKLLRWVFKRCRWASSPTDCYHSPEEQGVFTDEDVARANMKPGWWMCTNMPVNSLLPDETCQVGAVEFFNSPMNVQYRKIPIDTVTISLDDLNQVQAAFADKLKMNGRCKPASV